jgi:2-methylisocitrate lyase-like PEP mutase family enzyme
MTTQAQKAAQFRALHIAGDPLVLYNIWDAGGAKTLDTAGARAVATGSWSMAAAHGYDDGEVMPRSSVLDIVARIAASVDLPLSVDIEGGYATAPEQVGQYVAEIIRAGAVGVNFEDRIVGGEGLHPIAQQVARIRAIRDAAQHAGVDLFLNARTDVFLGSDPARHGDLIGAATDREAAYREAGADGFFVPGLTDLDLIGRVVEAADLPVNVMMMGNLTSVEDVVKACGIARASFGPGPYIAAMADLQKRFEAVA